MAKKQLINAIENLERGSQEGLILRDGGSKKEGKLPCSPKDYPKLCHLEHSGL